VIIPNPVYDFSGCDKERFPKTELKQEWGKTFSDPKFITYHGISLSSTTRLLRCYYGDEAVGKLLPEQILSLSPWVTLNLRNVISTTLTEVESPRTWYPVGFILEVDSDLLYKCSTDDAYIPMEGGKSGDEKYNQTKFRKSFLHKNDPLTKLSENQLIELEDRLKELNKKRESVSLLKRKAVDQEIDQKTREYFKEIEIVESWAYGPEKDKSNLDSLSVLKTYVNRTTNEVGFFVGANILEGMEKSIKIKGVCIAGGGRYVSGGVKNLYPDYTEELCASFMLDLGKKLGLPCYDLRK
jgi:hypothetical protein